MKSKELRRVELANSQAISQTRHNHKMLAALAATLFFQPDNTLTRQEKRDGWILLFDGKTTQGWHSFKQKGIQPGWTVQDGVLAITDADHAGDIVTDGKYDWFILELDWNVGKGQNSGVMLHVADDSETIWTSGPEVQIYDDHGEPGAQKNGFLYDLYDSKVDSTHPAGQWNHFRIVVTPKHCETDVNGVKYYDWVWGSEDFWARVAKSKFNQWPGFAKLTKGTIGLQGDHGLVQFKNIKLKPVKG